MARERPQIVSLGRRDTDDIVALLERGMPHIARSREWFIWQYFATPGKSAQLYGVREHGDLVSFYAAVATRVRVRGVVRSGRMIQDVVTHPDYRGRGYMHFLGEVCLRNIRAANEIGYTFPNPKSEQSFPRIGWLPLSYVPVREKLLSGGEALGSQVEISHVTLPCTDPITALWDTATQLPVGVHRDAAQLNWRYSKPLQRYHCYSLGATERPRALLILKVYDSPAGKVLHVCDLFCGLGEDSLIVELLRYAERFGHEQSATKMTAWLHANHPHAALYDDFGLRIALTDRRIFVTDEADEVWHLTQGDSDVY